jgi:hypothetical protein
VSHIYVGSSSANIVVDNNFYNSGPRTSGASDPNAVLGNPLFVNITTEDFHLQGTSPAIDVGVNLAEVPVDKDGVARPQGSAFDMGAYEYVGSGPTPTFGDVPFSHWAHDHIESLYQAGYISGCSTAPLLYCPEAILNRAESAVFVERGVQGAGYIPPDPILQIFADVPLSEWYAKWAGQLWEDGYTAGCGTNPLVYCPLQEHTRTEGTVFFLRMLHGPGFVPPDPIGIFADVDVSFWGAKWIEAAYNADLIPACQSDPVLLFCPDDALDRAMGAFMMVQAKGLPTQ